MKLFGKWDYEGVELDDLALQVSVEAAATILGIGEAGCAGRPQLASSASSPSENVGDSLMRASLSRRPVVGLGLAAIVGAAGSAWRGKGVGSASQHDSSSRHGLWLPASYAAASQLAHRGRHGSCIGRGKCSPKKRRNAGGLLRISANPAVHGASRCFS